MIEKRTKPPIVPAQRATTITPKEDRTGEVNPYALLNCNFEKKFYDRDICMYKNSAVKESELTHSFSDDKVSNFTYDKFNSKGKEALGGRDTRGNSILIGSMDDNESHLMPMGSCTSSNSVLTKSAHVTQRNPSA